ncbi:hypothetical protein BHE74_00008405 [Ensete ventricosum]|nr:hypothetical protein GW17_00015906 [Ensete ventricosum]RWW83101.1 hypothetical protein BHE74_00008405 [Ensete ventricosum]RZR88248.1 hypothetical protein BHM03_00015790 [Ensete ventricosum]
MLRAYDALSAPYDFTQTWTTQWELTESSLEVGQGPDDVVGSSSRTHQKFVEKFIGSSPTGCPELTESSQEECWKFIGSSPKETESSPGVHRKDDGSSSKRRSDNEDCTLSVVVSITMRVSFTNSIKRPLGLN